ncbi:NmrA-like family domain-containing protein [Lachnellula occidentalis]|uniref:NmrA-like family domain-containing protein n=1 Tax=Lachnellula occidentalis TaxID=215460 RepID=A0A8H8RHN0_9HELO|nr:NmrA-like family domain-containing protein [Lachnellula occidentalis]
MSTQRKTIVVVGASGNQGSSVAHTFLNLPSWNVRCVTRDPLSPASQALAALGAEVVQADLGDPASLSKAFSHANAIFVNTDFWAVYGAANKEFAGQENAAHKSGELAFEKEVSWGKNAAHAAAAVPSLERYIYSTLPSLSKGSNGKYGSHHNETKPTIVEYILKEEPELAKKTSFIYMGAYTTNPFIAGPRFDAESAKLKFFIAFAKEAKVPIVDPMKSTGPLVRALIEDEDAGTHLLAYDSYLTAEEIVNLWSKTSGEEAEFVPVTTAFMHEEFGFPKEVLAAPDAISEFGYMSGIEKFIEPYQLKKKGLTKSYEDWLKERDWKEVLESIKSSAMPSFKSME